MEKDKVNQIMQMVDDKIPNEKRYVLRSKLASIADERAEELALNISSCKFYDSKTTLLFSIFLGGLGIDRFYLGDTGTGIGKLLLGWLTFGIWPFIDIFFSYKKAHEKNFDKIMELL